MNRFVGFADRVLRRILPLAGAHRTLLKWRAWESTHFGEPEIHLLRYLVDPQRAAVDIGAAEGVYSFLLQRLARHCIAFEPNPLSHQGLKRALPEIEIHQAAVSATEGAALLRIPVVNGIHYRGWGTIEPKNKFAQIPACVVQEINVRTVRPDRMGLDDVGFIKIDVEGHELDVLTGLSELIAKCLPNLLIEIGDVHRGGSLAQVRRCLEPLGYIGFRIDEAGILRVLSKDVEVTGSMNVIFIAGRLVVLTRSNGQI